MTIPRAARRSPPPWPGWLRGEPGDCQTGSADTGLGRGRNTEEGDEADHRPGMGGAGRDTAVAGMLQQAGHLRDPCVPAESTAGPPARVLLR